MTYSMWIILLWAAVTLAGDVPPRSQAKVLVCPAGGNASSIFPMTVDSPPPKLPRSPACGKAAPIEDLTAASEGSLMSSKDGEDSYAWHTFFYSNVTAGGVFVELGALDGVLFSTTKFFEESLGWGGVLVEANPTLFPRLASNRRCSHRVSVAVCDSGSTLHLIQKRGVLSSPERGETAGLWELMSLSYRRQWYPKPSEDVFLPIECHPLQEILDYFSVTHVDFMSLSVQGAELSVLQTLNFSRTEVDVLVVDIHDAFRNAAVKELLEASGQFLFHGGTATDLWFVRAGSRYAAMRGSLSPAPAAVAPRARRVLKKRHHNVIKDW